MPEDKTQSAFPFLGSQESKKMEASYKVRSVDCSQGRHQPKPNGICMWCKKQVLHGNNEDSDV